MAPFYQYELLLKTQKNIDRALKNHDLASLMIRNKSEEPEDREESGEREESDISERDDDKLEDKSVEKEKPKLPGEELTLKTLEEPLPEGRPDLDIEPREPEGLEPATGEKSEKDPKLGEDPELKDDASHSESEEELDEAEISVLNVEFAKKVAYLNFVLAEKNMAVAQTNLLLAEERAKRRQAKDGATGQ